MIDSATKTVTDDNLVPTLTVVEHLHGVIVAWQRLIRLLTFILNIIFPRLLTGATKDRVQSSEPAEM